MSISRILILCIFLISISCRNQNDTIQIHYLGHAAFLIIFDDETSVLTDYGKPNAYVEYGWDSPIHDIGDFSPTIMTYSHAHDDHYDSTRAPKGVKYILKNNDSLKLNDLRILPIRTSENDISIKSNTSYLFEYRNFKILHFGDCQANIINIDSKENRNYINNVIPSGCDIILLPIESKTQFIPQAVKFIDVIQPKVVIPMHYWSEAYKSEFLNYIKTGLSKEKNDYQVVTINGSVYNYVKTRGSNSIYIINIDPSEYGHLNK